jgi:hypothetical protein
MVSAFIPIVLNWTACDGFIDTASAFFILSFCMSVARYQIDQCIFVWRNDTGFCYSLAVLYWLLRAWRWQSRLYTLPPASNERNHRPGHRWYLAMHSDCGTGRQHSVLHQQQQDRSQIMQGHQTVDVVYLMIGVAGSRWRRSVLRNYWQPIRSVPASAHSYGQLPESWGEHFLVCCYSYWFAWIISSYFPEYTRGRIHLSRG